MTTIRVPFRYEADVLEKRKRNHEHRLFSEWVEIEVRDVSGVDAPVALRWHDEVPAELPFGDRDRWGAFPSDGVCETRWLDGSHWTPVLSGDPRSGGAERMTAGELERLCEETEDIGNPLMLHFGRGSGISPLVPEDYRSVERCTREREIRQIMAKASDLVVIDGGVWKRTAEPVCYLSAWVDYGHSYQAPIKMLPADSHAIKDRTAAYRADRFDEACEAAILRERDHAQSVNLHRRVDVLIPESLSYRDEELALLSVSERLLDRLASKPLREVPASVAASWYVLREAWEHKDQGIESRCAAVEEAMQALGDDEAAGSDLRRDVARAIERWRSRPISVEDDLSGSIRP